MADSSSSRQLHTTFRRLSLGDIEPAGWLHRQLEIQAKGLTGHLDDVWLEIADSRWIGDDSGGWENGPYYADGLLPLAYLLNDDFLKQKADQWAENFLNRQRDDGWFGPDERATDLGYEYDPWPPFIVLKVMRQYHEATGRDVVRDAMLNFCRRLQERLNEEPLQGWAKPRWLDLVVSVYWLYERTGEAWLLELSRTAAEQGFDWSDHFSDIAETDDFPYKTPADEWSQDAHVVNHAMATKAPSVLYRSSGADEERATAERALGLLDRYHGQVTGLFTGDECLGGKSPTRGTELCAVVEFMYSLEYLTATFGEVKFADRLERVAFNALPAALTADMCAHQYNQQANQVLSTVAPRKWLNGPDANVFEVHRACCTANLHQGWPKFVSSLWMRADDGLAAVSYAPCKVETDVCGTSCSIQVGTEYPFEDKVVLTVNPTQPTSFTIHFRIPEWATDPELRLPSDTLRPASGMFHSVEREWTQGDTVELQLSPTVNAERAYLGSVALSRGPLVFSKSIEADEARLSSRGPRSRELFPTECWNYALSVDTDSPEQSADYRALGPGEVPFGPDSPPATLNIAGRLLPEWGVDKNVAEPVPASPVRSDEPEEMLTLVPYGCTNLRVTEFPILEEALKGNGP